MRPARGASGDARSTIRRLEQLQEFLDRKRLRDRLGEPVRNIKENVGGLVQGA
jgi:hypothetical protein